MRATCVLRARECHAWTKKEQTARWNFSEGFPLPRFSSRFTASVVETLVSSFATSVSPPTCRAWRSRETGRFGFISKSIILFAATPFLPHMFVEPSTISFRDLKTTRQSYPLSHSVAFACISFPLILPRSRWIFGGCRAVDGVFPLSTVL